MTRVALPSRSYRGAPVGISAVQWDSVGTTAKPKHWSFNPPDKRNPANRTKVTCKDLNGRFCKLSDLVSSSKSGV